MSAPWERFYQDINVLVTGGAGAIGSNLVQWLHHNGAAKVIVLDDLSSGVPWRIPKVANVLFVKGSVTNDETLNAVFREQPGIVFHLAARFANLLSTEDPETDLLTNGLGTLKVLQHALTSEVARVVYAASSSSHGGAGTPNMLESANGPAPFGTPYQATKQLGEFYCEFFSRYHNLTTVRPRLFNSYGPGEIPGLYRNVIPNFIQLALKGEVLPITGTGEETRDFTFVEDHVEGLLRAGACESANDSNFDLGTGVETCIADLAKLINELVGNQAGIKCCPMRNWDNQCRRVAEVVRGQELIGFRPRVPLREGLLRTIEWFSANWDRFGR